MLTICTNSHLFTGATIASSNVTVGDALTSKETNMLAIFADLDLGLAIQASEAVRACAMFEVFVLRFIFQVIHTVKSVQHSEILATFSTFPAILALCLADNLFRRECCIGL